MTVEELREAAFNFESHTTLAGGGFAYTYANRLDPQLKARVRRDSPAGELIKTLLVGEQEFTTDQWDEAVAALEKIDA